MANNEKQFRKELLDAAKQHAGSHYHNNSPENDIGKPDIRIKLPNLPSLWIECKFWRMVPRGKKPTLSKKQHLWIQRELGAGGLAVWAMCVKTDLRTWQLYIGTGESLHCANLVQTRKAGDTWSIGHLYEKIEDLIRRTTWA